MAEQQSIEEALAILESDAKDLVSVCVKMVEAYDGAVYPFDLFANGAANRTLALSKGFRQMIRDRNLICAGAILRLQLDTAFRFYAGFLVPDPHKFAMDVFDGVQIRNIVDMNGKKMSDRYLVNKLSTEFPWVDELYKKTCDYIHLSGTHMSHAIDGHDKKSFTAKISETDGDLPDHVYLSAIMAFQQSTIIFVRYLNGWIYTKANPEEMLRLKAERDAEKSAT